MKEQDKDKKKIGRVIFHKYKLSYQNEIRKET